MKVAPLSAGDAGAGLPDPYPVQPSGPLHGEVRVPGSKSLTNRCLVLAALAAGESRLEGALGSDDTTALAGALRAMGVRIGCAANEPHMQAVHGSGGHLRGNVTVNCGDGGTPARFLMAVAALADGAVVIDGSARLRERPMGDGADLLRALGVEVTWLGAPRCLPVRVHARTPPTGGTITVGRTASSQFVSALLLIAPWLTRGLRVQFSEPPVSASYIHLTVSELMRWGVPVAMALDAPGVPTEISIPPGPPAARLAVVEADASSAVYWAVAAAIVAGSDVLLRDVPMASVQPDMGAIRTLGAMGARVVADPNGVRVACAAPRGQPPLSGLELDCENFPDGALAVIAAAACARSPSRFTGLGTLRVKECDRVHALAHNLRLVGARCEEGSDWLVVHPAAPSPAAPRPAGPHAAVSLPTFRDHRVAMSFAVLGLRVGGISIQDPACVAKSYPEFWADLARLSAAERR